MKQFTQIVLANIAGLLLAILVGGCASHPSQPGQPIPLPTPADQVAAAEEVFETAAFGVGLWADLAGSPAEQRVVEQLTDAGRATIANLKAEIAAGKPVDLFAVLRSVRKAAADLRQVKRAAGADVPAE